ncbi:uncharacterized protein LACBIDRAFT_324754 [Laccaria bicolor S238N-H82]|uniref:Predicted protein n=1 Tax=Laccaria bicolor (strain S238N-H82 / ATCC MYA-4686) TaxID=486041 RepID=B0D2Y0_LACBS|nr:uncharacterized protein LACBIDRAFT_324754 [Laccaria bicolor S238N-H82]EDR11175.1 predicted protein [Laccaria bicolor S238N-H82]|eukprot:XP_001878476.1 predicted protein [Laccaria bicolor S238N-H82]
MWSLEHLHDMKILLSRHHVAKICTVPSRLQRGNPTQTSGDHNDKWYANFHHHYHSAMATSFLPSNNRPPRTTMNDHDTSTQSCNNHGRTRAHDETRSLPNKQGPRRHCDDAAHINPGGPGGFKLCAEGMGLKLFYLIKDLFV